MRVIAGSSRSIRLDSPQQLVRPTTDRTKETLFNMIQPYISNRRVLDLFAGSGSLGIEALSRGATSCVFVDHYINSIDCIKNNLNRTKLVENSTVLKYDYRKALQSFATAVETSSDGVFDLIFLDPPYAKQLEKDCLSLISQYQLLSRDGLIVIESPSDRNIDLDEAIDLECWKQKLFKSNKFTLLKKRK